MAGRWAWMEAAQGVMEGNGHMKTKQRQSEKWQRASGWEQLMEKVISIVLRRLTERTAPAPPHPLLSPFSYRDGYETRHTWDRKIRGLIVHAWLQAALQTGKSKDSSAKQQPRTRLPATLRIVMETTRKVAHSAREGRQEKGTGNSCCRKVSLQSFETLKVNWINCSVILEGLWKKKWFLKGKENRVKEKTTYGSAKCPGGKCSERTKNECK